MSRIHLCLAKMGGEEQRYIKAAFDNHVVAPLGPNVDGFEEDLKSFFGSKMEVAALSSGTAAVHLALLACGVQRDDEVLCQSFTFCASANPITYIGAQPVFIDSDSDTWNMDPQLLETAIQDRIQKTGKKPKAIIPVHLFGMPARIDEIIRIADHYDIPVIEDASESIGARYNGQRCGTFGAFGVLSFNGNKMITTSGGGALLCRNADTKRLILSYATQAREAVPYYQHERIGYNYRLSNICAGIGRGQMQVLESHIAHHKRVCNRYKFLFANTEGITLHENPTPLHDSDYWLNTILLDPNLHVTGEDKLVDYPVSDGGVVPNHNVEAMRRALDAADIEARPLWKPMHLQPIYRNATSYCNGNSERLFRQGLCLPSGPCVSDEDVERIVKTIKESLRIEK